MTRTNLAYRSVPLWLFVLVVVALVWRNRRLRQRPGNVSVRLRMAPGTRWDRGNGVWVDDVFAVRGGLADRSESYLRVTAATTRTPEEQDAKGLSGLEEPVIATLTLADGATIEIAVPRKDEALALGPFAVAGSALADIPSADQVNLAKADSAVAAAS